MEGAEPKPSPYKRIIGFGENEFYACSSGARVDKNGFRIADDGKLYDTNRREIVYVDSGRKIPIFRKPVITRKRQPS